jgi:hypothetical protein
VLSLSIQTHKTPVPAPFHVVNQVLGMGPDIHFEPSYHLTTTCDPKPPALPGHSLASHLPTVSFSNDTMLTSLRWVASRSDATCAGGWCQAVSYCETIRADGHAESDIGYRWRPIGECRAHELRSSDSCLIQSEWAGNLFLPSIRRADIVYFTTRSFQMRAIVVCVVG